MTTARSPFEYAVLRAVPRVERGEAMNVGVLLYSQSLEFLGGRSHVDAERLSALDPRTDLASVERAVAAAVDCTLVGDDDLGRRFRWLTAPRSTVVQPSPVHTGVTDDPAEELRRLLARMVLPPS